LGRSKRWGFQGEPNFTLWKPRGKGGKGTSVGEVLEGIIDREMLGLVEYKPRGEPLHFVFPLEFRRRYSGFSGDWVCVRVGSGGYATVYSCCSQGCCVALKVPRGFESFVEAPARRLTLRELEVSEELVGVLLKEVEYISVLNHPHLLKLIAYHISRSSMFLVYEYATHGSLDYQIGKGALTNIRDIVILTIQLADALRYLHAHGIIHGDVKPSNVLFVNRVAKLGDYSTADRALNIARDVKIPMGTPGWRAPEQVDRELEERAVKSGYQSKVDVYQLGNLLLYMLTGEKIDGEEMLEHEDHVGEVLNRLSDPMIAKLLAKMLEKGPWNRPPLEAVITELINILKLK
jgi:serine/threonine protein kinase